jgi:hypothetical protein
MKSVIGTVASNPATAPLIMLVKGESVRSIEGMDYSKFSESDRQYDRMQTIRGFCELFNTGTT